MEAYINIRSVRISKRMSQTELARKAHMAQSYLSELEHNKKSPTLRQLCKIAKALKVHPSELFYFL